MKTMLFVSVISLMLMACGSKTTEYYQQHPEEMKAKLKDCNEMPVAEAMADRECTAASNANQKRRLDLDPPKTSPLAGPGNSKPRPKF
jgi:hypothetical protein